MTRAPRSKQQKHCTPPAAELLDSARGRWREILTDAGLPAELLDSRNGGPCPRCGGTDRFNTLPRFEERGAVHCRHCFTKGTDPRPGDGLASIRWLMGCDSLAARRWLAGWLGLAPALSVAAIPRPAVRRLAIPEEPAADPARLLQDAHRWGEAMRERPGWMERVAELLGLPAVPLQRLGVGWSEEHGATTWAMRNGAGRVVGVRLRCPRTGRKWAVRGSRAGLIYPPGSLFGQGEPERLVVVEGPTDTAALLAVEFPAVVGRPSCSGSEGLLVDLCRRLRPTEVAILADGDGPGLEGAERLVVELLPVVPAVRVAVPPEGVKDARAWVCGGADRAEIEAVIDAAPVRSLSIGRAGR